MTGSTDVRVDLLSDRGQEGRVVRVTLCRPEVHNAINLAMWAQLAQVFDALGGDDRLRAVVMGGSGRSFSAGTDLKELRQMSPAEIEAAFTRMEDTISQIERLPVPVIGAAAGVAAGAGCELLLACDLRLAARTARLGMPVARLGIMIGSDFGRRLVNAVGLAHAREMLYTGRLVRGAEALRWGLVNRLVAETEVDAAAAALALEIAAQSPRAVRAGKRVLNEGASGRTPRSAAAPRTGVDPADFREGVEAWMERRPPRFVHPGGR